MKLHQLPENKIPENYCSRESATLQDYEVGQIDAVAETKEWDAWYWYVYGCYSGCGYMILLVNSSWYLHDMGHCSCYGPTRKLSLITGYPTVEVLLESCTDELLSHLSPLVEMIRNPEPATP